MPEKHGIAGNKYFQTFLKAENAQDKNAAGIKAIEHWLEAGKTLKACLNSLHWPYKHLVKITGNLEIMTKGVDDGKHGFSYVHPDWSKLQVCIWGYAWQWSKNKYNQQ